MNATGVALGVAAVILGWWIVHTKPTCRDGYVAFLVGFEAKWVCAPGYIP